MEGQETDLRLTLALLRDGTQSPARAITLLSEGPARAFGLPGGHLAVGAPADITLVDPDEEWTVDAHRFFSKSRNTPFHGRNLKGRAIQTWVGGRCVFEGREPKEST